MTTENNETENMQGRSALATLGDLRKGEFVEQLTESIQEVSTAVIAHSAPGKITITLDFRLAGVEADNALFIKDNISVKTPKEVFKPTLMFSDEEGSLTREDPKQPELELEPKVVRIKNK